MSSTTNSDLHLQKFDVDSHKAFPIEGRLRHHRGGLMTCTITNWTPAVVPHKIRTKKLMGSDLYWSINNQVWELSRTVESLVESMTDVVKEMRLLLSYARDV